MGRDASPAFIEAVKKKNVYVGTGVPQEVVANCMGDLVANPTTSGQVFVVDARISAT